VLAQDVEHLHNFWGWRLQWGVLLV
jgi:hypothetical protein